MLGCAQQEIEAHVRGVTREQDTTTAIDSTKSQTHSAKTAVFGIFSTNGSAVWPRHHRKLRSHCHKSGGMTPFKAPTRRRHAVRGLRMAQNPHHHRHDRRAIPGTKHPTTPHDQPPNSITTTRKLLTPYDTASIRERSAFCFHFKQ